MLLNQITLRGDTMRVKQGDTVEYQGNNYVVLKVNEGKCFCATAYLGCGDGNYIKVPVLPHILKVVK